VDLLLNADYLLNGRGTAIGTYSPRARPGFPIAAPVTWKRLEPLAKAGGFFVCGGQLPALCLRPREPASAAARFLVTKTPVPPSCTGTKYDQAVDGYGACGCLLFAFVVRKWTS